MSLPDQNINKLFFHKYLCLERIGKGSFGTVYSGINKVSNEKIAIKTERIQKGVTGTLESEAHRLIYLKGEGIPKIYCYGNNSTHNILVQELLGKTLEELFNSMQRKFSLKTVCVLGIEIIKRIQYVHSKFHLHRDIKPDNFMIGRDKNENKIYIIDFGLSKKYYSESRNMHIKFCQGKSLVGTARYCAKNAHRGYEQGRRDDIESIGYVLVYFLLGKLPWQGLKCKHGEDQFEKIAEKKMQTTYEELCEGLPENFVKYFKYTETLKFEEQPNYEFLIGLFQDTINTYCNNCFYDFDWKKSVCNYLSHEQKENLHSSSKDVTIKSKDMSLLVRNGGISINNESTNLKNNVRKNRINNKINEQENEEESFSDCADSFGIDEKEKSSYHIPKGGNVKNNNKNHLEIYYDNDKDKKNLKKGHNSNNNLSNFNKELPYVKGKNEGININNTNNGNETTIVENNNCGNGGNKALKKIDIDDDGEPTKDSTKCACCIF